MTRFEQWTIHLVDWLADVGEKLPGARGLVATKSRPEVEAFIATCRQRGVSWDELLGGKAERWYDHLQHFRRLDPLYLADNLPLDDLRLYGVAAEVLHDFGYDDNSV